VVWTVRLFAYLKDGRGESVEVEAAPTTGAVLAALNAQGIPTQACRLAVNHSFATGDQPLASGDELALIPPVSGG
jgi:molybdopterin converting factor small subunit